MSIKGSFYPTSGTDRPYYYSDYNANFREIFTNGIATRGAALGTSMQVSAVAATMKSQVALGVAYTEGIRSEIYSAAEQVTHDPADVTNPRYDIVALEVNTTAGVRNSRIVIVKGTAAVSPELPSLTQTATQYQMPLANVRIPAGATASTSFTYTDRRVLTYAPVPLSAGNVAISDAGGYFTAENVEAALQEIMLKRVWTKIVNFAAIDTSTAVNVSIPSLIGYNELMIYTANSADSAMFRSAVIPLNPATGLAITNRGLILIQHMYGSTLHYRVFEITSPTNLKCYSAMGTSIDRIDVFVR